MCDITCIERHPDSFSPTVVRNILAKVRCYPNRNQDSVQDFYFRHDRYYVTAFCRLSRCLCLFVSRHYRDHWDFWIIKPVKYSLLPSEAFDL